VKVRGEVDLLTAPEFERVLRDVLAQRRPTLVDLTALDYIDTKGLSVLDRVADMSQPIKLKPSAVVRRLIHLMGIHDRFLIVE
jgi:anti-anti-sigma factor